MDETQTDPFPKSLEIEVEFFLASMIQIWMLYRFSIIYIPLKHQSKETKPGGKESVVQCSEPISKDDLS